MRTDSIWMIWSPREAYRWMRAELRARDATARFIRLSGATHIAEVTDGFDADRIQAAVHVGADEGDLVRAETLIGDVARTGRVSEIVACMARVDAGAVARCFFAGATEVIAVGEVEETAGGHAEVRTEEEQGALSEVPARVEQASATFDDRCAFEMPAPQADGSDGRVAPASVTTGAPAPQAGELDICGASASLSEGAVAVDDEVPPWDEPPSCDAMSMQDELGCGEAASPQKEAVERDGPQMVGGSLPERIAGVSRHERSRASDGRDLASSRLAQGAEGDGGQRDNDFACGRNDGRDGLKDGAGGHRAPVVTVVSGRGGSGKTTLVASMAACAARAGLRVAVLDLDLMFGNVAELFGVEGCKGIERIALHATDRGLDERDVEATAMRVGPGLTVWGPCGSPESAETCSLSIERLVGILRGVADVIFIDTSGFWGDAVAMAVACCDRCLVVGDGNPSAVPSAHKVIELATRVGVPRTRMTCVFNRMGARGSGEEQAIGFEMGTALRSRARMVDGGDEVRGMLSFGQVNGLIAGSGAFAQAVREFTSSLLQELGCPIAQWLLDEEQRRAEESRVRFRLPWRIRERDAL